MNARTASPDLDETLAALTIISAPTDTAAQLASEKLRELRGCELHMTHIRTRGNEAGLKHFGINLLSVMK